MRDDLLHLDVCPFGTKADSSNKNRHPGNFWLQVFQMRRSNAKHQALKGYINILYI